MHSDETPVDRFRLAVGLHELGVSIYRQRLRREHPDWDEARVYDAVGRWLATAPAAPGRPASPDRLARIARLAADRAGRSDG